MLIPWINLMLLPWTSKLYYKSESLLDLRAAAASGQCIQPSIQSSFRLWLWFWWKLWWSCTTWCRWKLVIFHFSFSLLQPTLPSLQSGPTTGEGESDVMGFFQKYTWICLERQDKHYIGPYVRLDPDHWASLPGDEACGGTNQSPIDLV